MDPQRIQEMKRDGFKNRYFFMVALFYVFQGFYQSSLSVYQAYMLNEVFLLNVSMIALVNFLVILPNYLKMFTGLLSDRVPIGKYRRVPYIIIGTLIYIPFFIILANLFNFNALWVVTMLALSWGWALVDGTLDALTIDVTPDSKLGMMNGASWAARSVGSVGATLVIAAIAAALSWKFGLYIIGAVAVLQGLSALTIKEPKFSAEGEKRSWAKDKAALAKFFKGKQTWLTILFVLLFNAGPGIYAFLYTLFIQVGGFTAAEISVKSAVAFVAMIVGVLLFGRISDKIGAKKIVLPVLVLFWISVSTFFLVKPGMSNGLVIALLLLFGFSMGGAMVPGGRISMEIADPEISGFVYSGLASVSNFAQAGLAGLLVGLVSRIPGAILPIPFFALLPVSIAAILISRKLDWWEPGQEEQEAIPQE